MSRTLLNRPALNLLVTAGAQTTAVLWYHNSLDRIGLYVFFGAYFSDLQMVFRAAIFRVGPVLTYHLLDSGVQLHESRLSLP